MSILSQIERSIIKRYRKFIWSPFVNCINRYEQIDDGDKIAVFIDGSAQSFLAAKCLEEIKKHGKKDFTLKFFTVISPQTADLNATQIITAITDGAADTAVSEIKVTADSAAAVKTTIGGATDTVVILQTARALGLNITVIESQTDIQNLIQSAVKLGADTLALSTVFEHTAEKVLYNLLEKGKFATDAPLSTVNGVKVINPFYHMRLKGVSLWAKSTGLVFTKKQKNPKYIKIRALIDELNENYHLSEFNIVKSLDNINIDTLISYSTGTKTVNVYDYIKNNIGKQ